MSRRYSTREALKKKMDFVKSLTRVKTIPQTNLRAYTIRLLRFKPRLKKLFQLFGIYYLVQ